MEEMKLKPKKRAEKATTHFHCKLEKFGCMAGEVGSGWVNFQSSLCQVVGQSTEVEKISGVVAKTPPPRAASPSTVTACDYDGS